MAWYGLKILLACAVASAITFVALVIWFLSLIIA